MRYKNTDAVPIKEEGMKPVVYQKERMIYVLHKGVCGGHKFCILNLGTHPTAYVECKLKDCYDYHDGRLWDIPVNGGFTYFGEAHWDETDKTKYLGWDYGHCGDFAGYYEEGTYLAENTKKWTTEEIYAEVLNAISHLVDIERSNENAE